MKPYMFVSFALAAVSLSCSSGSTQTPTTIVDPIVVELQKKVDELQKQVNSTTTTTTTTEVPKPARVKTDSGSYNIGKRGFGSNVEYGCRDYDNYSDDTFEITREYWITEDAYRANNGC